MVLASSIWKQIAPWVYQDANKKKKIQAIPWATFISPEQAIFGSGVAPTVTPSTTTTSATDSMYQWLPTPKVATKQNPVVDMSKPKQTPSFNQYDTSAVSSLDMNWLQDFIDQTNIDVRRWTPLTPEREAQLMKAQRRIQELNTAQQMANPIEPQISALEEQKKREAERLALQSTNLIDKRRAELEAQYWIRTSELDKQWQSTMSAAQWVLSFSWFGRSTYAADKQAEIQQNVNQAKQSLQAEKDYAIARYQAELAWADAETLASYDEQIGQLRQLNTKFLIDSAQAMNEYNMQTSASYEEKISNIFKLAEANNVSDLTEQEKAQASAYGDLLLDAEWNLNTGLIKDIPARLVNEAIMQWAMRKASIKPKIEAPKTASDWAGNLYQFNEQTWERTTIGSAGKEFKTVWEQAYAFDPTTGQTTMVAWWTTWDLRWLSSQFPWQARAKNNNPAGITRNNNFATGKGTAALLDQAGIPYEIGTARPKNEWWNYVSFPTIEDWLAAQRILMTQTYWNSTVQEMLWKWVWTGEALNYAKQVAWNAWVPLNIKVNQLNEQQIQQLQMAKIQKESPWLAKLLWQAQTVNTWWYEPQTVEEEQLLNSIQQSKGKKVLPSWTVTMLSDGKWLPQLVSTLSSLINTNKSKFWPIAWRLWWWNEYDTEAQKAQAQLKLASQTVGKFMEWWVLRKEDEVKYEKMLPTLKDTPEVALSKVEQIKALLENKYKWYIQDFSNSYDVTGFPVTLFNAKKENAPVKYTPNTDYSEWTIIEKDWVMYSVWKDWNFYEQ